MRWRLRSISGFPHPARKDFVTLIPAYSNSVAFVWAALIHFLAVETSRLIPNTYSQFTKQDIHVIFLLLNIYDHNVSPIFFKYDYNFDCFLAWITTWYDRFYISTLYFISYLRIINRIIINRTMTRSVEYRTVLSF